jgi:DNA polymerase-3 subunit delta'
MRYPWQEKQWQQFWQAAEAKRLPHALLLTGMAGTGKTDFALHAAQALLCPTVSSAGDPCETCHACRLVKTAVHPNVYHVVPEKEGHAIKVDQIRELALFVQQSSMQGEYRIVLIRPAHSMNINAANALLKTLEEPASGAVLMLVTDQISQLPATIRSRCQRILFPRPGQDDALCWLRTHLPADKMQPEQWLRLAHGAPLLALTLTQDDVMPMRDEVFQSLYHLTDKRTNPLALAAKWQKMDTVKWLDLLLGWVSDLIRLQLGGNMNQLLNQDYETALNASIQRIPLKNNLQLMDSLLAARNKMHAGVNFNKQLLMESLMISWLESTQ